MADPGFLSAVATDLDLIDGLGIAALALDAEDRALRWNREFLELFPEHAGHIHKGEPYAENLRRFYQVRLDAREIGQIEVYVADAVARHRRHLTPFEFQHRGQWVRVEVVPLPEGRKLRYWTRILTPIWGDPDAGQSAGAGSPVPEDMINQIADGLVLSDAQERIVFANQRFARLYGLGDSAEVVGKTFQDVLELASTESGEALRRWSDHASILGAPFDLPLPGDRWVRVRRRPTQDGRLISTHVEVTDLFRVQRSLAEARNEASELAKMLDREMQERKRTEAQMIQTARLVSLGQMATGLAHELNQPLAVMALAADVATLSLQKAGAAAIPEVLLRLESIATTCVRAREVVDHLRLFGREEYTPAAMEPVDLRRVVEGALLLTEAAIRSCGIALNITLPATPIWVMGRAIPLEQVLMNLLLNARDAIVQNRTPAGEIGLAVAQVDGRILVTASDNGGGFSAAALQHALEPFFTTKEAGTGTGLGLSLAYTTITAIGGSLTLRNAPNGAIVEIALPAAAAPAVPSAMPRTE